MMKFRFARSIRTALALLLLLTTGCQSSFLIPHDKWHKVPTPSDEHPVYEIICLWEPGEGTGMDGLPARGFLGQLMFFAHGIASPVRIKGPVRIYVFDDQGTAESQQRPIHEFNFCEEAFNEFLTESNIGAAYQFFIPYSRKGSHRAVCSLRVRYTPEHGQPVYSKMGSVILAGTSPRKPDLPVASTELPVNEGIQLMSHEAPASKSSRSSAADDLSLSNTADQPAAADKARLRAALSQITGSMPATVAPASSPNPREQTSVNPLANPPEKTNPLATPATAPAEAPAALQAANPIAISDAAAPATEKTETVSDAQAAHPIAESLDGVTRSVRLKPADSQANSEADAPENPAAVSSHPLLE
jgi:hypothetical protein